MIIDLFEILDLFEDPFVGVEDVEISCEAEEGVGDSSISWRTAMLSLETDRDTLIEVPFVRVNAVTNIFFTI